MSLSLGEKLREAREERGFTIADVAEQTRISSLYLESIENDDYRILPGGIFNKGFVKSYAKFVGINEAEALQDYSALLAQTSSAEDEGDQSHFVGRPLGGHAKFAHWPSLPPDPCLLAALRVISPDRFATTTREISWTPSHRAFRAESHSQ